ncbi:multidrug effflux MFS transporter [Brevundimonas diminuta]|uniref:multidrug effflux MFS transporter n=1 Tax=Brevundimonas diminuta TaxID=293 RepID=UPI003D002ABE
MTPQKALGASLPLIVLLGILTATDALSIDMYLPAFSAIQGRFGADAAALQFSLSLFLIGLAVGQAVYGPVIDRFGRRVPLLVGIGIFTIASVLIAAAPDTETFLIGRFVQGLGGAAGLVIPRAIVADLFEERQAAKVFSMLMQVMAVGPIIAPLLGGFFVSYGHWTAIFWTLAGVGLLSGLAVIRMVPESLPPSQRQKLGMGASLGAYVALFGHRRFMALTLSGSFVIAGLFSYISGAAFVFTDYFALSPAVFSYIFAAIAASMIICGQLNVFLLGRVSESRLLSLGLSLHMAATASLLIVLMLGLTSFWLVTGLILLSVATLSLILGNVTSLIMSAVPGESGVSSALFGVIQYAFGGLAGVLMGLLHDQTIRPLAIMMAACALLALICWRFARDVQAVEGKKAAI